jgi:hypothetical protein
MRPLRSGQIGKTTSRHRSEFSIYRLTASVCWSINNNIHHMVGKKKRKRKTEYLKAAQNQIRSEKLQVAQK